MTITPVTRRALLTELADARIWWAGVLEEPDFLARLYAIDDMPSTDDRFSSARGDVIQHRVNNLDWPDDWVFADQRFGLDFGDDEALLRFLAETLHPEVRPSQDDVTAVVQIYNRHLSRDGWELYQHHAISGRPVFAWRPARPPELTRRQIRDAIAECVAANLKAYDVTEFCEKELGLDPPRDVHENPFNSKRVYVSSRLHGKTEPELLEMARRLLVEFGDPTIRTLVAALEVGARGVAGELKNLIFAADGPKPEIVLRDAINNDIEITANAEYCLVYDRPLGENGLTWRQLVGWWRKEHAATDERSVALDLHGRLVRSLAPGPEQLILRTYAALYGKYGFDLPALLPQVYLHYDPLTERQRGSPGPLFRQRMDFLLLLPRRRRVVIELDGKQHYADGDAASPVKYAQMVREDRALRLAGYDVFRIGGYELADETLGADVLGEFFLRLLALYEVALPTPP